MLALVYSLLSFSHLSAAVSSLVLILVKYLVIPVLKCCCQLSYVDTREVSCHSLIIVLLSALESLEGKKYTSYRNYSTDVYIQNH